MYQFFYLELAKTHENYGFIEKSTEKVPFKIQYKL